MQSMFNPGLGWHGFYLKISDAAGKIGLTNTILLHYSAHPPNVKHKGWDSY